MDSNTPGPSQRRRHGFTLIEIMAVVLILGLLTTLVGVAILPQLEKGRISTTRSQIKMLDAALETYRMDNARFPTTEQGLDALVNKPADARNYQEGGYLRESRVPKDPWGNPYQYEAPGQHNTRGYDLWSLGPDGAPGGDGNDADIGNWFEDVADS
jgi:general secretion pathway protein G